MRLDSINKGVQRLLDIQTISRLVSVFAGSTAGIKSLGYLDKEFVEDLEPSPSPNSRNNLLNALVNELQPCIEYKEWPALGLFFPTRVKTSKGLQSRTSILEQISAYLINAHDVAIVSVRLSRDLTKDSSHSMHFTAHCSWVDNDTWISEAAELSFSLTLTKRKNHFFASSLEVISCSTLVPLSPQNAAVVARMQKQLMVCTVATDRRSGLANLEQSCQRFAIPLRVYGKGAPWRGFNYNKLKGLYFELGASRDEYEYVLFTDAYDSIMVSDINCIMRKFFSFQTPLLFSAEVNCWPASDGQKEADYPPSPTKYRYLNGGGFIGRIDYLLELMTEWGALSSMDAGIDQQWWAHLYLSGKTQIKLDYRCEVFQCLFMCEDDVEVNRSGVRNRITGASPCILHGNGGARLAPIADNILRGSR